MELLDTVILKLNMHTEEIKLDDLQKVMLIMQNNSFTDQFEERYTVILDKLWSHLTHEFPEFDDQLLCSTCFYSVLRKCKRQEVYLNQALKIINHEILCKEINHRNYNTSVAVSLCYGMFQSSYLMQKRDEHLNILESLLKANFKLMTLMAYEYSEYTFIVFKVMTAFKKVIETSFRDILFNTGNEILLLNLINHNWENPITGVRNLNQILFQTLLLVLDSDMYEKVLNEINGFYWNKAKFLMLTEIIGHSNKNVDVLVLKYQWLDGLVNSLWTPGLVSAGADMYNAILKKLILEDSWSKLYLTNVMKIFTGSSFKAIENFTNYWCLTTFKKFPTLAQVLTNELHKADETELKLYSQISILKQANKLGLIEKNWEISKFTIDENMVLSSLEHCNVAVRMLAFEIICVSHKKGMPSYTEYREILKFLQNNVNSDCTVLRFRMLNNLAYFFITLHTSFLNYSKIYTKEEDINNFHNFCEKLQMFVYESLNLDGNYQRKITTVKTAYLILKHFNEVPRKKKKQTREMNNSLIGHLKYNGHWLLNSRDYIMKLLSLLKDPATDIHDCVQQLLLDFYLPDISDTITMNYLIEESLKCIKSKFFYDISCGLNIFKVVINILIQMKTVEAKFKTIEDIFYFTYNEITAEYNAHRNVVDSIARGKQMHSFLSVLYLIFDVITKNSYQIAVPDQSMITLLHVLKDTSTKFAWEEDANTSSDFSKMNDMVVSLIKSSSLEDATNQTEISGLYQIVLNCLWLNVKASCELASILIQYNKQNYKLCEESLNIIAHVLETSRHKGAIEAAGTALGQGIRYLTSSEVVQSEVSKLPLSLLKRKLVELLLETTKMSSVTRRGAGLSIMIHRIVCNDARKGKPLYHYFMKTILNTCNNYQGTSESFKEDSDEKDLPKAIYIHFLTRIVTDSSLASHMMYYSADLAALAFGNLTNTRWQIRNAALQLYGALIPKLIGQKKPSGNDDEIISAVAFDEFRTHSRKLWDSIMQQIKNDKYKDTIQGHSNLVPILNTLANIAHRYNFSYDLDDQLKADLNLLPNIFALLGSPIYTVRRLTSKLIINVYSFETILNAATSVRITSENHLHGILMLLENCYKVYSDVVLYKKQLDNIKKEYCKVLLQNNHSFLCKWSLDKLSIEEFSEVTVDTIKNILIHGNTTQNEPGVFLWINQKLERCLNSMHWDILPEVISLLLNTHDFKIYCEFILKRIKICEIIPKKVLLDVSTILLSSNKTKSSVLWKTLYYISQRIHHNMQVLSSCYLQEYLNCDISYNMRYMIPFATRLYAAQQDYVNLLIFSRKILLLCSPESNNTGMRHIAAIANNELALIFANCTDNIKVNAIKSAVILLQDEDEDIRNISIIFHKRITRQSVAKHPFICLNEILEKDSLSTHFNDSLLSIQMICDELLQFIDSISINKSDELNPFANDSKNIYFESNFLKQLLINLNNL